MPLFLFPLECGCCCHHVRMERRFFSYQDVEEIPLVKMEKIFLLLLPPFPPSSPFWSPERTIGSWEMGTCDQDHSLRGGGIFAIFYQSRSVLIWYHLKRFGCDLRFSPLKKYQKNLFLEGMGNSNIPICRENWPMPSEKTERIFSLPLSEQNRPAAGSFLLREAGERRSNKTGGEGRTWTLGPTRGGGKGGSTRLYTG